MKHSFDSIKLIPRDKDEITFDVPGMYKLEGLGLDITFPREKDISMEFVKHRTTLEKVVFDHKGFQTEFEIEKMALVVGGVPSALLLVK